jgi:hypothetical protein
MCLLTANDSTGRVRTCLLIRTDHQLINDFRSAPPGSRAFKTRLIEMAAVGVHEIAVQLFNLGGSLHSDDNIFSWVPSTDDVFWELFPDGAWPTLFRHAWYVDFEQYPDGVADMAGYWAEARILGGVVLFDRRGEGQPDAQPDSVWFHSDRSEVTYRIYQLHDDQKQRLVEFLTSEAPDTGVLPILGDASNVRREDPEEPVEKTGIYRNVWERKPLSIDAVDGRLRDVWNRFEYPSRADLMRAKLRARERSLMLSASPSGFS